MRHKTRNYAHKVKDTLYIFSIYYRLHRMNVTFIIRFSV